MKCECGGSMVVTNTVSSDDEIYRERRCSICKKIIYTEEFETLDPVGICRKIKLMRYTKWKEKQ